MLLKYLLIISIFGIFFIYIITNMMFPKTLEIKNPMKKEELHSVTIYLSDQSFRDPLIKIRLKIDNEEIIETYLFVGLQHTRKKIKLNLKEGLHTISVEHLKRSIRIENTFNADKELWILVNYWYDQEENKNPHFTIDMQEIPFVFD